MKTKSIIVLSLFALMAIGSFTSCNNSAYDDLEESHDYQEYLDLSDYSDLSNLSESDRLILQQAEERINVQMVDGFFNITYNKGSEINISERLFDYISGNYNYLNSLIGKTKKVTRASRNVNRTESSNPYQGEDCVPIAISHYCGIPYNEVLSRLVGKHLTLLEAVQIFKSNAQSLPQLSESHTSGILTLYEHAVNLSKVEKATYNNINCYKVYYKDYQQYPSDGGNGYTYVANLNFPCQNIYGNLSVIFGLIQ